MEKKIINLNLITSYPVKWDMYKILRDFIQNFYDSVNYTDFHKRFFYGYSNGVLEMKCTDVSYNYEWLLHIGASSKTNEVDGKYAGYFGEGFKIATLCAMRDYKLDIETSSAEWEIKVIEEEIKIDNNTNKSLAYELKVYKEKNPDTILRLGNFKEEYLDIFKSALNSFYYENNPLIGKCLFKNNKCSIHYRSEVKKNDGYPTSYKSLGNGIIFAGYQARGSIKEDLIFSYHKYKDSDRDRNVFSDIDNIDIIIQCIREVDSKVAMELLILFKKYWYTYPKGKYGYNSYYSIIKNLIFALERDLALVNLFKSTYPNLLYAEKISQGNKSALNQRKYCMQWLKNNSQYLLVQDGFRYIGIHSIEARCEKENALPKILNPTVVQEKYIKVLQSCVKEIFIGFLELDKLPTCKVIKNVTATVSGYASLDVNTKIDKNLYGYKFRYRVRSICIMEEYFKGNNFEKALTTYVHELCHTFGGDKSENFSYAITIALEIILINSDVIEKYRNIWLGINNFQVQAIERK